MGCHRPRFSLGVGMLAVGAVWGCAGGELPAPSTPALVGELVPPSSVDDSTLCKNLADRFIGLPSPSPPTTTGEERIAASAGRWWVRKCSARAHGPELEIRLAGPGWYWVDETGSGIRVAQQVPFELSIAIIGQMHEGITDGIFSLWFELSAEPQVRVSSPPALHTQADDAWGDFLSVVPGVAPEKRAAERFNRTLSEAFAARLRTGATLTYDIASGQVDATLGRLAPGKMPPHPFEDEPNWIVNDRMLLAPSASQVMGPIEPGELRLNVIVEHGPGLAYRAICEGALRDNYADIAEGAVSRVPATAWAATGAVEGLGERTASLRVERCRFYLVAWTSRPAPTLAAIRVRS